MAFATGRGVLKSLDRALDGLETLAGGIKGTAQVLRDRSAVSGLTGEDAVDFFGTLGQLRDDLNDAIQDLDAAAANAFAVERYNNPGYDISAEFIALQAEVDAVLTWMQVNISVGSLLVFNTTTRQVDWQQWSVAQTAGFRTVVDALIASID